MIFVESIPNEYCPKSWTPEHQVPDMVFAPHWYGLNALFAKAFGNFTVNVQALSRGMFPFKAFYWGQRGARDSFALQIRNLVEHGYSSLGEKPVVIGECGIPMDMNKKEAFVTEDLYLANADDGCHGDRSRTLPRWLHAVDLQPLQQRPNRGRLERRELFLVQQQTCAALFSPVLRPGRAVVGQRRPHPPRCRQAVSRQDGRHSAEVRVRDASGAFTFEWGNAAPESESDDTRPIPTVEGVPRSGRPKITALETEIFLPSLITFGRKVVVDGLDETDSYMLRRAAADTVYRRSGYGYEADS
ncbi:putative glycoside hydrolase family 5 protein [Lyophyllum shimeji]|uniref:Glycoside hydrolase family 5 protein n=1 Tax=Lyophyllum shimeji TaxID=47721 RepID=A0A9P3PQM0_LYOSH|nr:putative glycoside hydrolase family 5 protein [Lyophyllum shimeji]